MSVAVERRTVSLWAADASPLRSGPPHPRQDPASEALAAITSRYRRGRAGIIAGDAPPTHSPTVPLTLLPKRMPAEVVPGAPAADQADEAATFWSRLVRSRRPAPRGRHSPRP